MRALAALLVGVAVVAAITAVRGESLPIPAVRVRPPRWLAVVESQGVSVKRFVASSSAGGAVTFMAVWAFTSAPLVALVPAAVIAGLPAVYYQHRAQRADQQRLRAWPDVLRSLAGSLAAGSSLHDACVQLSHSGPLPLRDVFARYAALVKIMRPAEAFSQLRRELAHPVSDEIFEVLAAAAEEGSRNIVQILEDLSASTTANIQLAERIETQRVQLRLNARAVFIVPWATLIFLASRPGMFRDYYSSPDAVPVLLLGAAMSLGGMGLVHRLGRIPEQPRILASDDMEMPG